LSKQQFTNNSIWEIIGDNLVDFPVYIRLAGLRIHPHLFFESLAYVTAFLLFLRLRKRQGDQLSDDSRWWVISAAVVGAALGSRLLGWFENIHAPWYTAGKTIVGGLAGGLIAVEITKKRLNITSATGDLFVFPLIVGIAIGRIGCFLTGLADDTYGTATTLPWGIDFGDGIPRHPTQLYEILFLSALGLALTLYSRRSHLQGDVFKLFMAGYMGWRLAIDFLKPGERIFGLTTIQLTCVLVLIYYMPHLVRIARTLTNQPELAEPNHA
jgi:phosphatidylglycerol---prolipoprotein diacylglyceryl transferase